LKLSRQLRILVLVLALLWLVARSAKLLVVNDPQRSDVILVLAGETDRRPARALELMQQGYAKHVVLNVPANAEVYGGTYLQLAQNWIGSQPQADFLSVCPIQGLSTKAESLDADQCLRRLNAHSVLIVTSDYHTRRALSEFRKELPQYTFHVAAAYDPTQFGQQWWRHRQWAKVNVDEWARLFWWELVDRWF
jgi:DUF218 domain